MKPAEAPMVETIGELTFLSRQLNDELHKLNTSIEGINEKLRLLDFGAEVWLPDVFLANSDSEQILGYCKVDNDWQLAIRKAGPANDANGITPLLKAPRQTRIAAVQYIPAVLNILRHEVQNTLLAIAEAKRLADEL
jgi:hypothetical protein